MENYLKGLAELLWPSADKAGITICVEAPAEEVVFDAGLLSPALINLCANAIKASRRGDTVWLQGGIDHSRLFTLWTVKDHGHGLPSALADRLRDSFAAGEVMPGTMGIGMGLTVVVTNVRAMGGTLSLNTPQNTTAESGVTTVIRLPFEERREHSDSASERIRRRIQLLPIKTLG